MAERAANTTAGDGNTTLAKAVFRDSGDQPGFGGASARDGRLTGVKIETDWAKHPPKELWRHRIGPGWSSFAVIGQRVYTQEQRDKIEAVVYGDAATARSGRDEDETRFNEDVSGAGPRGSTPTFHDGKILRSPRQRPGPLSGRDDRRKELWGKELTTDAEAKVPNVGVLPRRRSSLTASSPSSRVACTARAFSGTMLCPGI